MKRRIDVSRLLDVLGIRATRARRGKWQAPCPNPEHDDRHPSWSIIDDGGPRHGSHWCHSCGFGGGPWELVAAVRGLSLATDDSGRSEAGEWCWKHVIRGQEREADEADIPRLRVVLPRARAPELAIPNHVHIPSVDGSEWYPRALSYLDERGIPEWQRVRWHMGYSTLGRCAWRVFVPVYTGGLLRSYVARSFLKDDPKRRYLTPDRATEPGCRPDAALWGEPGFDYDVRTATATEGVFKGLAMERACAPNPCAVLGSNNLGADKIALLTQFDALLIATDPDKAGDACAEKISDLIVRYTEPVRVRLEISPDDATEEMNAAAWREAIRQAAPAIRARRSARFGSR